MISKRLSSITPSYTIGISSAVNELKSQGIDVVNLSIGEPDFNVPENAKQKGIQSIENNCTKYDLVPGLKALRLEIAKKLKIENNSDYCIDEIVISSGAKHAITNTLLAVTNPGDDILIPKPYWVSYPEMIKLVGANPIFIETKKDNNFKVTVEDLKNSLTPKTKMLFINNPSNPAGTIYSKAELEPIVKFCIHNNILILADEIYEKICYEDTFTSIASLSQKAKDITITINGFSKSSAMTGLRLGYSASNKTIAKAISTIQGHLVSHPALTSQYIGLSALKDCCDDISNMVNTYKSRRDLVTSKLDSIENLSYIYPKGAFYVFIDISNFKNNLSYSDSFSAEFCKQALENFKVALVPGVAFGMDDYIRISYACNEAQFLEGLNRLESFLNSII